MMVKFTIPGTPVGKGRPRFARRGSFVVAYTPEKTASYENLVKIKSSQAMIGETLIEGAAKVSILLEVVPPASWSAKKRKKAIDGEIWPTSKPDLDNVMKVILDACNEIVWKDDKQVCDARIIKRYSETAQATVEILTL